jgi:hypothetical protein
MIWIAPSEKNADNATLQKQLCRLNLAVHVLESEIRHGGNVIIHACSYAYHLH